MLHLFRRRKSGLKWTLWFVIVALSGGMVLLFVDTRGVTGGLGSRDIALVGEQRISAVEYRRAYNSMLEYYRQQFNMVAQGDSSFLDQLNLGRRAYDELLTIYVIAHEAESIGLQATSAELVDRISSRPVFQENGQFIGAQRYRQLLTANNLDVVNFENAIRREIMREKLLQILTDGIHATGEEVRRQFDLQTRETKIRYILFNPEEMTPSRVSNEDLQNYFESNRANYRTTEQRKIRYLQLPFDSEAVELTEEQIRDRMASMDDKEAVQASHILIRIENDEDEPEARQKIEEILNQLQGGADFARLAQEHSQDQTNAGNGGDLGFFSRGRMVPEFERVAFAMEPGQLSGLVRTSFGFHLIKVTDVRRIDTRTKAEEELRQEEIRKATRNAATKLAYEARNGSSLEMLAERDGLLAGETNFFSMGDIIAELPVQNDFNQQVFTLAEGQIGEPYAGTTGYILAQLSEIQPPENSDLEAVKESVLEDFKSSRAEEAVREKAFAFAETTQEEGQTFQGVARRQRLSITISDFFTRSSQIDDTLGMAPEVMNLTQQMKEGEISPPLQVVNGYTVFQVTEIKLPGDEEFEQEKETLTENITGQKRSRFFSSWIQAAMDRLREQQEIQENLELVDDIVDGNPVDSHAGHNHPAT